MEINTTRKNLLVTIRVQTTFKFGSQSSVCYQDIYHCLSIFSWYVKYRIVYLNIIIWKVKYFYCSSVHSSLSYRYKQPIPRYNCRDQNNYIRLKNNKIAGWEQELSFQITWNQTNHGSIILRHIFFITNCKGSCHFLSSYQINVLCVIICCRGTLDAFLNLYVSACLFIRKIES